MFRYSHTFAIALSANTPRRTIRPSKIIARVLLACSIAASLTASAQTTTEPTASIEVKIDRTIADMTLEEKISLISGGSVLGSTALPRLGIPAFRMGDGPIGAHDPSPSTAFAAGIALAATWDRDLADSIGTQIGRDSRSRGAAFLLGPGMNIYRAPMNGRNHEYFGEDPFLAGQMAAYYVQGVQSQNVAATIKHFVGNNSEFARFTSDTVVSERALREIYLPAFEAAVTQGHAAAIMDSYNQLNGTWMTENAHLNTEIAKRQWRFDGLIMSDWIATHDAIAAANGGLDLEMPAPLYFNPQALLPAIQSGKVKQQEIDDKVRRLLRVAARFGWITPAAEGVGWVSHDPLDIDIPRYNQPGRQVALQGALESETLLKNDGGLLPLDATRFKKIAVIGPDADPGYATGGGSGMVPPVFMTGPFKGISDYLGVRGNVTYTQGIDKLDVLAQQTGLTETPDGATPGVLAETFSAPDFTAKPTATRHEVSINAGPYAQLPTTTSDDPNIGLNLSAAGAGTTMKEAMRTSIEDTLHAPTQYMRWTGYYHAKATGEHIAFVEHPGRYRLLVDGKPLIDHAEITAPMAEQVRTTLTAGVHKVVLEDLGVPKFGNGITRLGIVKADAVVHPAALELAKRADVVVLSVGFDIETEGEGADREFQLLPGQQELIEQVAAVNPRTVVVLNAGGSVDTQPWLSKVPALLHIWYAGQGGGGGEGGIALGSLLFGDANPSGRLPISWERSLHDNPSAAFYYTTPATNRITYGDDIFVGYRGYEHNHTQPLFPFGFGLSYTSFHYANLAIQKGTRDQTGSYTVGFDVTNTGKREGADVAQIYISEDHPNVPRPPQELKGFARVALKPGETKHVTVPLDARSFAWFDVAAKAWHADSGTYTLRVSRSSADPQLEGTISLPMPILIPVE